MKWHSRHVSENHRDLKLWVTESIRKAIGLSKLNVWDMGMFSFPVEYILPDSSSSVCSTPLFSTSGAIFLLSSNQGRQFLLSRLTDITSFGVFIILNSLKLLFQQSSGDYTRFSASKEARGVSLAPFSILSDRDMAWHGTAVAVRPLFSREYHKAISPFSMAGSVKPGYFWATKESTATRS